MTLPEGTPGGPTSAGGDQRRRARSTGTPVAAEPADRRAACSTRSPGSATEGDHRRATRSPGRRCCRCCTWCSRSRATSARTASGSAPRRWSLTNAEVSRGRDVLHDVQAHAVRRAPGERLHQHAVRGARRRRDLRAPAASSSADGEPLGHEETAGEPGTPGSITLEHAECLAACDLGPGAAGQLRVLRQPDRRVGGGAGRRAARGEKPRPTRGAPLTDLRTVELELAGIFPRTCDVPAVDGPSAAPETLRGAQLAADRGWTAPAMPDKPPALPELPEKK